MDDLFSGKGPHYVNPQGLMMVKGWGRSVAAFTVMLCMYESQEFCQAGGSRKIVLFRPMNGMHGIEWTVFQMAFVEKQAWPEEKKQSLPQIRQPIF